MDKIELRVEQGRSNSGPPFTEEFSRVFADIRNNRETNPFRENHYYQAAGSLTQFGYDVRLHLWSKPGRNPTHKIEFLETGSRPLSSIVAEGNKIFDFDIFKAEVVRIDLATDLSGIPVSWFSQNATFRWKQWTSTLGKQDELARMGKGKIETLYFGKRPNLARIYDKRAEMLLRYKQAIRKTSKDQEFPRFEDVMGFPEPEDYLTRIERQIGGGRIPPQIGTIKLLKQNALSFNPFENLVLLSSEYLRESKTPDAVTFYAAEYIRERARAEGLQNIKKDFYRRSHGQGARTWKRISPYLVMKEDDCLAITQSNILDSYYTSLSRQLSV